jgi:hypothetical protein
VWRVLSRREVSDDVLHAGDGRESCAAIAFLSEALGAARMDKIPEFFREAGLGRRVVGDDSESVGCFDVVGKVPLFEWFAWKFGGSLGSFRQVSRWALLDCPE